VDLKLRISEKIVIAELRSCGCGATFFKKLRNRDSGSVSFKLRSCDCGLKKKLRVPTSDNRLHSTDIHSSAVILVLRQIFVKVSQQPGEQSVATVGQPANHSGFPPRSQSAGWDPGRAL
jgi:hypothetical protein